MSFGLGLLAGIGRAQRSYNEREADASLQEEKKKNDSTASLLHDFMLREDVTPDVKNAALTSLMTFSQTKGMPGAKHRQAAMEPVLAAMNTPRQFTSPDVAMKREQGRAAVETGQNVRNTGQNLLNSGAGTYGSGSGYEKEDTSNAFAPDGAGDAYARSIVASGQQMEASGREAAATPGETRTGPLRADELAQIKGRATGVQTRAMIDAMRSIPGAAGALSGVDGVGYGTENSPTMMLVPDGHGGVKPHIVNPHFSPVRGRYIDSEGNPQEGWINYDTTNPRNSTDGDLRPIHPTDIMTRNGWMTVTGVDSNGNPTKTVTTKSDAAGLGPVKQFVRKVPIRGETVTGDQTITTFDPASGAIGSQPTVIGQKTNSDLARQGKSTDIAVKQGKYRIEYDPESFGGGVPAGQPTQVGPDGKPIMVGTKQFRATIEPGSVLQRASAARTVMVHGEDTAKMVEDPKNADLFGKVKGRWNELLVEGPQMFAAKWVGPIGTNDTRLAQAHAALKSISDLLTTVHGRRAEESARNFEHSLALVNSPQALAAVIRTYTKVAQDVAAEGNRPITPVTTSRTVPRMNQAPTTGSSGVTHRYVPGQGLVPVTSTATPPTP